MFQKQEPGPSPPDEPLAEIPMPHSQGPGSRAPDAGNVAVPGVLSVAATAEWLGMPVEVAERWLKSHGLIHAIEVPIDGVVSRYERVAVREVLDVLGGIERRASKRQGEWISTAEAAAALGIDRSTLDAMVDRAPTTCLARPRRSAKVG